MGFELPRGLKQQFCSIMLSLQQFASFAASMSFVSSISCAGVRTTSYKRADTRFPELQLRVWGLGFRAVKP